MPGEPRGVISIGGSCDLLEVDASGVVFSEQPRTVAIVTFALCAFANFSSIAIQMAVTGGLAPNQRATIAKLGLRDRVQLVVYAYDHGLV